jgi:hypothetical protein
MAQPKFTFVLITWNPPHEPNGVVTQYDITFRTGLDSPNTTSVGLTTKYTISGLTPESIVHEVLVSAYNIGGKGEAATLQRISTLESPRKIWCTFYSELLH